MCGEGKQLRTVVCQAVTKEGWILPGEVLYGCRPEEKPSTARYCSYGDCNAKSHWTVGSWSKVSSLFIRSLPSFLILTQNLTKTTLFLNQNYLQP